MSAFPSTPKKNKISTPANNSAFDFDKPKTSKTKTWAISDSQSNPTSSNQLR